jgi:Protein of unknown function (DUF3352)
VSRSNPQDPDQPWVPLAGRSASSPPSVPASDRTPRLADNDQRVPPEHPTQQFPTHPRPAYSPPQYPQQTHAQPGYLEHPTHPPRLHYQQQPAYRPQHGYPQQQYGATEYADQGPWVGNPGVPVYGQTEILGPSMPSRRRRRRTVATVIGVVLSMLVAGTAIAGAFVWYGWGTTEPEDVLPGSSMAFARVDLSPGLGQQLALGNIIKKFPQQQTGQDAVNTAKQRLVEEMLPPLKFDTDIKPWLGDRMGLSLWSPAGRSTRCTLVALASSDDDKANSALQRVTVSYLSFAFSKGYAILATCPGQSGTTAADDAVAAADSESLSQHAAFADALGNLPSGQAILAWMNGSAVASGVNELGNGSVTVPIDTAMAGTTMLVAVKATGDGLELRARVHTAAGSEPVTADALSPLGKLPGGTVVGVSADLRAAKGLGDSLSSGLKNLPSDLGGGDVDVARITRALLGSVLSLSIVNPADPQLKVFIEAADSGSARDIANVLQAHLSPSDPVNVTGNRVSVTTTKYQGGSGSLAEDALYRSAMDDPPDNVVVAAYANVGQLTSAMKLSDEAVANIKPVKAIGMSMGVDHDSAELLIRVIVQ